MKKKLTALVLLASLLFAATACASDAEETSAADTTTAAQQTTTAKQTTVLTPPIIELPKTDEGDNGDEDDWTDISEMFIPYGSATVDGVKDESWANAATVSLDMTKKDSPNADTYVEASAMWDENGLYFLFEITDSDIYTGGTLGDYNNDGIYLYVSEDPMAYWKSFEAFAGGTYQFALIADGLEMIPRHGDTTVNLNAQTAYTRTETGMIIEFSYVPYHTPVAAGNFLLMDFQYNDCTSSGKRSGGIGWYNGTDNNSDTMLWAVVKLLAEGETAPN
ncbi:MAG: hypothetical protein IJX47_01450 [Clostridia bacterium]|nr:hypothetical protein [Clostridia bacterium]